MSSMLRGGVVHDVNGLQLTVTILTFSPGWSGACIRVTGNIVMATNWTINPALTADFARVVRYGIIVPLLD